MTSNALMAVTVLALLATGLGCTTAASTAPDATQPEAAAAPYAVAAIRSVGKHKGDYLPAHNFKIEIDGVIVGGFKEVSGLGGDNEVIAFKDGDDALTHRRAGKTKFKNIVLKRGFLTAPGLAEWFKATEKDASRRKSGSVILLDREGEEAGRLDFDEAWPVRYKAAGEAYEDVHLMAEIVLAAPKPIELKTKHDTAKNSVGNIR